MRAIFCLVCIFFLVLDEIHGAELPKGVPLSRSSFYQVGKPFTCLDGSSAISWWKVNDDYCDCRDGSDEPGTSACLNGRFFCRDMQYRPVYLPSAYVNDTICDCCDGGDEYQSSTLCPSTCGALAASLREAQSIKRNEIEQGHKIFKEYVENLKERKAKGLFKEQHDYDETHKLAEYDIHSDDSSSSSGSSNDNRNNEESTQVHDESVNSHLPVDKVDEQLQQQQTFNAPSSSSMDSNQQSATHDDNNHDDNQLVGEHDQSSSSGTEYHEKQSYDNDASRGDNDDRNDNSQQDDHDESNTVNADKQLHDDESSHHENIVTPSIDEKFVHTNKPTPIPIDYGPEEGFRMLTELQESNGCLELNDREYTYSLCPFKSIHQRSIGSSSTDFGTCIGRWGRWLESDELEKTYKIMYYDNGLPCWNGPTRSTKVFVHCGDKNQLTSVSEPSRCEYVMQLITPAACNEDPDELFKKLHPEL
ncbi:unnamed protein product [Schistosoma turkestanicum]|nr:unnamed protein product [Schistosoma turkestanicum]